MQSGEGKPKTSIIDHLLQDELAKFTSVDDEEQDAGARPLSAEQLAPGRITERSRRPLGRRLHRPPGLGRGAADARPGHRRGRRAGGAQDQPGHPARRAAQPPAPCGLSCASRAGPVRPARSDGPDAGPRDAGVRAGADPRPGALPPEALSGDAGTAARPAPSRSRRNRAEEGPQLPDRRRHRHPPARRHRGAGQKECAERAARVDAHRRPRRRNRRRFHVSLVDEGEIGTGGTSTVRRMYDPSLRRRVALKSLWPELAGSARALRDFVQEAEITAQLEHPDIIPIHEQAMVDGRASFSMRLIRGQTFAGGARHLGGHSRPGGHAPSRAERLRPVCDAVALRTAAASFTATSSPTT